jgi:transcriptional regulator with XRE-family HTH domain
MTDVNRFINARQSLRLSIEQCAALLGVSPATIKRWEKTTPNRTALNYLEIKAGDLGLIHRKWNGFFITREGCISNGRDCWPPDAYHGLHVYRQQIREYKRRLLEIETNGFQFDLFAGYAAEQ